MSLRINAGPILFQVRNDSCLDTYEFSPDQIGVQYSEKIKRDRLSTSTYNSNQLEALHAAVTRNDPNEEIEVLFQKLFVHDRNYLSFIVWATRRDKVTPCGATYGEETLRANFRILQRIQDTAGLPILEQMITLYRERCVALQLAAVEAVYTEPNRNRLDAFITLLREHIPDADKQPLRAAFAELHPEIKNFLAFSMWMSLDTPNDIGFGERKIFEDPTLLLKLTSPEGSLLISELHEIITIQEGLHTINEELARLYAILNNVTPQHESIPLIVESIQARCEMHDSSVAMQKFHGMITDATERNGVGELKGREKIDALQRILGAVERDFTFDACQDRMKQKKYFQDKHPGKYPSQVVSKEEMQASRFKVKVDDHMNVLIVAYEVNAIGLKFGGLGEAIYSQAQALVESGHTVTILTPKFDALPDRTNDAVKVVTKVTHQVNGEDEVVDVHTIANMDGIKVVLLDGSPEHFFNVTSRHGMYQDGIHGQFKEPWYGLKHRMVYFSSVTAEYIAAHKAEIDVVEFNDWHCAAAINHLYNRHQADFLKGKLPANVFVIHNNGFGSQGVYDGESAEIPAIYGGSAEGANVMLEASELADAVVTVSPTFGEEMQSPSAGAGIDKFFRKLAHGNKFTGILNGSNPGGWDPGKVDGDLATWREPTEGLTLAECPVVDLSYTNESLDILEKREAIKMQLSKWIEVYGDDKAKRFLELAGGSLEGKDVIFYVGRYDSTQKGIDQFVHAMRAAHAKGAVFITMGNTEDPRSEEMLDNLERVARDEKIPAWIQRECSSAERMRRKGKELSELPTGVTVQAVGSWPEIQRGVTGVSPGVGELIRSCATFGIIPSSFEPCGLVQFESWLFGVPVIATSTGGLADTVNDTNGYKFTHTDIWDSEEQNQEVARAVTNALETWRLQEDRNAYLQKMMRTARDSSWTSESIDKASPIQQYERVFAQANLVRGRRSFGRLEVMPHSHEVFDLSKSLAQLPFYQPTDHKPLYETYGVHFDRREATRATFRVAAPRARNVTLLIEGEEPKKMTWNKDGSWTVTRDGVTEGMVYSYAIEAADGLMNRKSDPYAFAAVKRGRDMFSVVGRPDAHTWGDANWVRTRKAQGYKNQPTNITEVHLGSFKRKGETNQPYNYREYAEMLVAHCNENHYTHVELLGIIEHPLDESWGYHVTSYFAPTNRYGSIEDFQFMVDYLHQNNIGVYLDWVPAHFAQDEMSLVDFDGEALYNDPNPMKGIHPTWGSYVFDYSNPNIRNFLISSAEFWTKEMHVDGLRVDAVASLLYLYYDREGHQWSPNAEGGEENLEGIQFLKELNSHMLELDPSVSMMAEESSAFPGVTRPVSQGGLGFLGGKWDMGRAVDAYDYMNNYHRSVAERTGGAFNMVTRPLEWSFNERFLYPRSHDEVVHGKGSEVGKMHDDPVRNVCLLHGYQMGTPSSKLSFMGNEFGAEAEWNEKRARITSELTEEQIRIQRFARTINLFYKTTPAFYEDGRHTYEWIKGDQDNAVLAYRRKDRAGHRYTVVHNFSDHNMPGYELHLRTDRLREAHIVLNSEAIITDTELTDRVEVVRARTSSMKFDLPPFSTLIIQEDVA